MKYVALLRGIGPGDPNMRNEKLRQPFEALGFHNIQTVISSGNVLFETAAKDIAKLEQLIEKAISSQLGFTSSVVIRSQAQLQELIKTEPFTGLTHGSGSYLLVTFFQKPTRVGFKLPHQPEGKPYKLVDAGDDYLCTVTDNTVIKTTDVMGWLEKQFGKDITSRTWLTVQRILKKMAAH